jgi:hypothetical protein
LTSILSKSRQKRPSVKIWSGKNCTYTHTPQNKEPRVFVVYFLLTMPRVFINNCSIEELMSVTGIGAKVADKILELREAKGDLELCLKMASRNKLLPVWGSHLRNTRATETRAGVYT